MFGIPPAVGEAIAIAEKAQNALKDLKILDLDHDGKSDLTEIVDYAKSMAPDMVILSEAMAKGAALLAHDTEPAFSDVVGIAKEVMPVTARLSETAQKIFSLASLDMKALGDKYKIDLQSLF